MAENNGTDYPIIKVNPNELNPSAHQPESRMAMSGALNQLKRSIQEVGLQYPPLVTRKPSGNGFTIVDGHRRIAAMKALAWPTIPVLVAQGRPEQLFSAVSGTTKPITAIQWLEIYLKGGEVPSGPTKVNIRKLDEIAGHEFLKQLLDAGLSPQIWSLANRMIRYAGLDEGVKHQVLNWLLKHKITREVSAWISGENPAQALVHAFKEDRPPKLGA